MAVRASQFFEDLMMTRAPATIKEQATQPHRKRRRRRDFLFLILLQVVSCDKYLPAVSCTDTTTARLAFDLTHDW